MSFIFEKRRIEESENQRFEILVNFWRNFEAFRKFRAVSRVTNYFRRILFLKTRESKIRGIGGLKFWGILERTWKLLRNFGPYRGFTNYFRRVLFLRIRGLRFWGIFGETWKLLRNFVPCRGFTNYFRRALFFKIEGLRFWGIFGEISCHVEGLRITSHEFYF